jgi:hypothetical protein
MEYGRVRVSRHAVLSRRMSVTPWRLSECTVRRVGDPEAEHVAERADYVEEAHTSPVRPHLRLRTERAAHVRVRVRRARARAAHGGGQRGEPRGGARRGARRSRGRSAHIARPPPSPPPNRARCARAARTCSSRARRRAARRTTRGVGDPEELVAERADQGKTRVHRPSAPVSASEPGALRTCACACAAPRAAEGSEANRCAS